MEALPTAGTADTWSRPRGRVATLEPDLLTSVPQPPPIPDDPSAGSEAELIVYAQAGQQSAQAELIRRYWDRLFGWLYQLTNDRHQAEDLTQETFMKALAALPKLRPDSNFRAWLYRIAHNNFVNLKRSNRRANQSLPEETPERDHPGVEAQAEDREMLTLVSRAIQELSWDFRMALLLRAEEGLSFREIAQIQNTTEETARWRVFKARQKLLKLLPPDLLQSTQDPT